MADVERLDPDHVPPLDVDVLPWPVDVPPPGFAAKVVATWHREREDPSPKQALTGPRAWVGWCVAAALVGAWAGARTLHVPVSGALAAEALEEVELGTVGRITGRQTSHPVWFVRRDDTLLLLPITGSDSNWYKNIVASPTIHLAADGAELNTEGTPITDPGRVRSVVDDFRAKYGADQVARSYQKQDVAVQVSLG